MAAGMTTDAADAHEQKCCGMAEPLGHIVQCAGGSGLPAAAHGYATHLAHGKLPVGAPTTRRCAHLPILDRYDPARPQELEAVLGLEDNLPDEVALFSDLHAMIMASLVVPGSA